jgi:RHS repeat-associated protein
METTDVFYFAGRPVAQLKRQQTGGGSDTLLYLTTDHLGTPIQAMDTAGGIVWEGGLEPFGAPFVFPRTPPPGDGDGEGRSVAGTASAMMESAGIFLRYPGQWDDPSFRSHELRSGLYYNLNRWYEAGTGRYASPDPLGVEDGGVNSYLYALANPLLFTDPNGLVAKICCRLLANMTFGTVLRQHHCYVKADSGTVYGLYPEERNGQTVGVPRTNDPRDKGGHCEDCGCDPGKAGAQNACLRDAHNSYPIGEYHYLGPNSNTYAGTLARKCCKGGVPDGLGSAPGIKDVPPAPPGPRP